MLIHNACRNGNIDGLSKLLENKCDINAQDEFGNTGLIYACFYGHKEIVSMLIKAKCNLNIQNESGDTGLIYTCSKDCKEIVSMLIKAKCNLNIQDICGNTGLIYACRSGYKKIIVELVRYDCKIDESSRKEYPNEINRGIGLRTQLFDTCIRYVLKNMDEFENKIYLLPRDIRKHLVSKN